eukprot:Skav236680  [mRNA]  locus=scaffold406:98677:101853:- [translate_table: standard]
MACSECAREPWTPLDPIGPQAKGDFAQHDPSWQQWLTPLDNAAGLGVWIPSYIAYGLVDTMAPLYGAMAAPMGKLDRFGGGAPKGGKAISAPRKAPADERLSMAMPVMDFHEEMLRKLALHLAAREPPAPRPQVPQAPDESPERVRHFCALAGRDFWGETGGEAGGKLMRSDDGEKRGKADEI